MARLYSLIAAAFFLVATLGLMAMAVILLLSAFNEIVRGLLARDPALETIVLDGIGLLIIGFAVVETAKFIAEEELYRKRELRSIQESRRSLTKFVTIIVIAASLEALVMIFKAAQTAIADAVYPAFLFIAAMLGLAALGVYQWLSSHVDKDGTDRAERGTR